MNFAHLIVTSSFLLVPPLYALTDVPLVQQLLGEGEHRLLPYEVQTKPSGKLALRALQSPGCAAVVGGEFRNHVRDRFLTTEYFTMASVRFGALQSRSGSIQTLYGYSYSQMEVRRVLLFPAFLRPQAVLTRLPAGGALRVDSQRNFAQALGLNPGIGTEVLQAIILLHEQSHLNFATFDDLECLALSMLNSRRVAEACFPQEIEVGPGGIGVLVAKFNSHIPATCGACHPNRKQLVKTPKAPKAPKAQRGH